MLDENTSIRGESGIKNDSFISKVNFHHEKPKDFGPTWRRE
jgi:hypothetical protein